MQQIDAAWPDEARSALREAQREIVNAGCGGCVHAEWAASAGPEFMKQKPKFHVAMCRAGVQLEMRDGGLLNAVTYCTVQNKPIDAVEPSRRAASQAQVAPTLRHSPFSR